MELVKPDIGLIFWQFLSFGIVLFILGKFAWKPILTLLHEREASIEDALQSAQNAKAEMEKLQSDNAKILAEAQKQKDELLAEARDMKDQMIAEAKKQATEEGDKLIAAAKVAIENEKATAVNEIKSKLAELSVSVAEKIIVQELGNDEKYNEYISKSLDEFKLN